MKVVSVFPFWPKKALFALTMKMTKNNKKKILKKADSTYFFILHKNMFPMLRKQHYLLIFLVSEVLTHLPIM